MTSTAVDPMLFASLDPPRLAGSRCASCDTVTFPAQAGCAKCTQENMAPVELADRGTLWTWTVQAFEPKAPYRVPEGGFTPYGVGYVDLGEVIVVTRFTENDPGRLAIGTPVGLCAVPAYTDGDGTAVVSYGFAVAAAGEEG